MEKKLNVVGMAKRVILYRGQLIQPRCRFEFIMNENDFNALKDNIEVLETKYITDTPISATLVSEPKVEEKIELKGEEVNVKRRVSRINKR
ncbi:MAG: hypothetical protein EOL95_09450 [Bacteroidia bacterium]|nr:hypothetical protein [Bacteroidia bacterium]